MKVGDEVKHRSRLDVGVGKIIEISGNLCTVEFQNCRFSGIPVGAVATLDQIEQERRAKEIQLEKERALAEEKRILKLKSIQEEEERKKHKVEQDRRRRKEAEAKAKERTRREINDNFSQFGINSLWHMTHKDNILGILEYGILNHYDAHEFKVNRVDISDPDAQRWREYVDPHFSRKIHEYAPLYIKPRNPMLYVRRHLQNDLCLVEISFSALYDVEYLITDGNAASRDTQFFKAVTRLDLLPWAVLNSGFWPDHEDGKRKMCSEVLIYPKVTPKHIMCVHCYSRRTLDYLSNLKIKTEMSRTLFF